MNNRKKHIALCFLFCFWSLGPNGGTCLAQTDPLPPVWDKFTRKAAPLEKDGSLRKAWDQYVGRVILPELAPHPGRLVGNDAALFAFMGESDWRHRATSYEVYFASSRELARSVYGLAVRSGDVDRAMPLERFEKGVRGFHYSIGQVCSWVDAVLADEAPLQTDEERRLLRWLLRDGAVGIHKGKAVPGERIRHIIGAAPGKKRSFAVTLRHERLHVLWDEDPAFAERFRAQWRALGEAEKQAERGKLAAYAQGNEAQLVEEWAIYQAENMPDNERKALVGL